MSYEDILKRCLIQDEGCRKEPYLDTEGHWTIGIGHNLDAHPLPKDWTIPLTDEQIDKLFHVDIFVAIKAAQRIFRGCFDDLSDNRKAAVVNLLFNMGETTFSHFVTTIAAIRNGMWEAAGAGLKNSKWYGQVQRSRSERIIEQITKG